ncbi:VOC family protein [Salibacteraceae bacterium]|nr:VOC family protein [Salibacteraceae bacterium]
MKNRVTGIGGIFFKSKDPKKVKDWYSKHLGIESDQYGSKFLWKSTDEKKETLGTTVWSPMGMDTDYYSPSDREFMINYRVENLEELLEVLESEGVAQVGKMETYDYGKFAWIMDPDGTKIELWEPKNESMFHDPPYVKSE